jgi:hypothetical protein
MDVSGSCTMLPLRGDVLRPERTAGPQQLILPLPQCELNAFARGQGALQRKARNLIFTHECDARMGLRVDDEIFEHLGATGTTDDAIVR